MVKREAEESFSFGEKKQKNEHKKLELAIDSELLGQQSSYFISKINENNTSSKSDEIILSNNEDELPGGFTSGPVSVSSNDNSESVTSSNSGQIHHHHHNIHFAYQNPFNQQKQHHHNNGSMSQNHNESNKIHDKSRHYKSILSVNLLQPINSKPQHGSDEWYRQRRENHKEVERRRRESINQGIKELAALIPTSDTNKAQILQRAVEYIKRLKESESNNIEKWTLEKLLTEQAVSELSISNEKLKNELERAYREIEKWKKIVKK